LLSRQFHCPGIQMKPARAAIFSSRGGGGASCGLAAGGGGGGGVPVGGGGGGVPVGGGSTGPASQPPSVYAQLLSL
jgi:hypothetical protein